MMVNACLLVISLLLIQHPAASHGRQQSPNAHQRSLLGQQIPADSHIAAITTDVYEKYEKYVTPWHDLGVTHHMDVGSWGGLTYQIHIWLRFPCSADSSKRPVRLVVALNQAPARKYFMDWTEVIPNQLLVDGKLPAISFRSMADPRAEPINATISIWEDLVKSEKSTGVLVGHATLNPDVFYVMWVEGSERVFQIPPKPCSAAAKNVFGGGSAWIGIGGRATKTNPPATYAFLVAQHVRHHMRLGFAGLAIVVQPHVAVGLLATAEFAGMVEKQQIVLLTWEWSYKPSRDNSIQATAQNLISMAMHGAHNYLGVWDLDEYLVLPSHRPVMHEMALTLRPSLTVGCDDYLALLECGSHHDLALHHCVQIREGCFKDALQSEQQAVLPFELASASNWSDPSGEISAWLERGSFEAAIKHLNYTMRSYAHCKYGRCKSLVDPNTDLIVRVHELLRLPPKDGRPDITPRSCAYVLHFFQLWGTRPFTKDKGKDFLGPVAPLQHTSVVATQG